MLALGLMSGTSLDGVDAAILDTDGESVVGHGPGLTISYLAEEQRAIEAAIREALSPRFDPSDRRPDSFAAAETALLAAHMRAIDSVIRLMERDRPPCVIGYHGQTVLHRPDKKLTIQLGDGQALADATSIQVVGDMRSADLMAGGQGAPLVPIYHQSLAAAAGLPLPVAILNLGGVGNVTWIGSDGALMAFDTGPANGLIDQMMQQRRLGSFDAGGRLAAAGRVDYGVLSRMMDHPYFGRRPPKSLDRYDFSLSLVSDLADSDAAATLTEFTAATVESCLPHLPQRPLRWIVVGGGRHNGHLMSRLALRLKAPVDPADGLGWRGDLIEAEAMALLAVRSIHGLPLTFPGTTGAPVPLTGGRLHRPVPGSRPDPGSA